ncbi:MAG: HEAT repeat domain-containing protein [Myxococcales bacterium]|nr:HEAT repeat domain-containing protein [Myxococcales bacterium]
MQRLVVAGTVLALARSASAGQIATVTEDLDRDGTTETIELTTEGVVTIDGKLAGRVKVAATARSGRVVASKSAAGPAILVDVTSGAGREALILERTGGAWKIATRFEIGGVGLDADYAIEVDATPIGIIRYQSRAGLRRCDATPAYLFPEGWTGTKFQRLSRIPTGVPAAAPAIAANLDKDPAPPPVLFRARVASHQIGAGDAGGLGTPAELDDAKPDTQWREELTSDARGQFFTFETRVAAAKAKQLRFIAGGTRLANRLKRLGVVTAQGAWHVDFPDAAIDPSGSAYVAELPEPIAGCVTLVIEETYGPGTGATAIAELEVFADGERAGGGDATLVKAVADGKEGANSAAQALARRGAAGAQAIETELLRTADPGARSRLVRALVPIKDPAAGPPLARAAASGWVRGKDLIAAIDAMGELGMHAELAQLAGRASLEMDARVAAVARIGVGPNELPLLVDLAGKGQRPLRRAVIERLASAPVDALVERAAQQTRPTAAGDLWRAATRRARATPAERPAALAALLAALPSATDYERRYRLIDGLATLGDAAAITTITRLLASLPAGAETSALRQVAIRAIGSMPRLEALGLVLGYAQDPDPGVRLAVLSVLAGAATDPASPWHSSGTPDGIDRVIINALSGDRWPEVRRRAATALGARCLRPGPALALTEAVKKDDHLDVRRDSLIALVECRAPGVAELLAKLWDDGKAPIEVRVQAVDLAVALGDPRLGAALIGKFTRWRGAAIESAEALALAQSAAASIARLRVPGAAQALMAALDDSAFPEIVSAAAQALGALGPDCPPAAKAKLAQLGAGDDQAAPAAKRAAQQCGR